jgi:hypothetical protein
LAIDSWRTLWAWGTGDSGQLGFEAVGLTAKRWIPERVPGGTHLTGVAGGKWHTVVARADGAVLTTGWDDVGQLGLGPISNVWSLTAIPGFSIAPNAWLLTDADEDGLSAWTESLLGLDPLDGDTNHNGVADGVELDATGLDPLNPDSDADGLTNSVEMDRGTDPFRVDSDGDGVANGADAFPLDPTRSTAPDPDPSDTTAPVITLIDPTNAQLVP